ncbi:aminoglycoside phosphotransferase family protein [Streptomyces durmitorensis]|uniref:Aminoglycoside phosphotransferase family protein n=1 Tax=Streptomyces durmitorensis TaxID=319947 RepID=A0ABY4Q5X5_9ACTN|nr:aminoglycoside phosphotransferase family protein [Streptomyces durmitorensis]UQT60790.1 aminoglycoside phosphotransferase family protein [Streptomyces durmitorensis]
MTPSTTATHAILQVACLAVGLDSTGAEPIRIAENSLWRLPGGVVVRIAKPGQYAAAEREVQVARWLVEQYVPAVRVLELHQPVAAHGHPVTFWQELPPHENGTVADVVALIKQLHALPKPDLPLGELDPFVRLVERIDAASTISDDDREWMQGRLEELKGQWNSKPNGLPECVVHGDAWVGNVARTEAGPLLLDFERASFGPPEWDLVSTAVKLTTTGAVSAEEYAAFCDTYGVDVTEWGGYELLSATRQLRMATYAAQHAANHPEWRREAQHRIDCLRGRFGAPPWRWKGIM